ncbi:TPA: hypothetical protein ACHJBU_004800 [Klebsiella pneumoniae]
MNINERARWESEISLLTRQDKVEGGRNGAANIQAGQLANRTSYLKQEVEAFGQMVKSGEMPYDSLQAAQNAIDAGTIPETGRFSFRSDDASFWAEEGINTNGVATRTGKRIYSSQFIAATIIAGNDEAQAVTDGLSVTLTGQAFRVIYVNNPQNAREVIYLNDNNAAVQVLDIPSRNTFLSMQTAVSSLTEGFDSSFMVRDGVSGFSLPVMSPDGRVIGFNESGGVTVSHVEIPGMDAIPERDAPFMLPIVGSKTNGVIAVGLDPDTGEIMLRPDGDTIDYIGERLGDISGGYLPPSTVRGGYEVSAVREKGDFYYATVQERFSQKTFDAKQKKDGAVNTLVPDRVAPVEVRGLMSQSNGVLAGDTPVRESRALFPFSALSFRERNFAQGGSGEIDGNSLTEFTPLADAASQTNNNLPATMTAFAHEYLKKEMGGDVPGQVVFTAGQGSVAMSALLPGTVNWKNYFAFLSAAKRIAATYGRDVAQSYVTIIQGENGTNYAADFATWADAIIPEIKRITGQSTECKIVLWQITGGGNGYENGVGALQLNFLDTRDDILIPGPMYGYPTAADRTHLNAYGRMMMGECQAYMELMIANGMEWRPFRMKSATRNGKIITIETGLPPGTVTASRDSNWMPDVPQDGFVYANNSDGVIAVSSVAYSGSKITLTLASEPTSTAGERISYGLNNSAGSGWAWYGGKAMAESNIRSPFNLLGHPVPEKIRHYLLRERIGVTV